MIITGQAAAGIIKKAEEQHVSVSAEEKAAAETPWL